MPWCHSLEQIQDWQTLNPLLSKSLADALVNLLVDCGPLVQEVLDLALVGHASRQIRLLLSIFDS